MQILEDTAADARAPRLAGSARFTYGWLARWIIANTEPPSRHRCKAPQAFVPKTGQPAGAVLAGFCQLQQQLSRHLQGTAGLDLSRIKARAPWIAAHQRRHLWQARQARRHANFPRI